MKSNIKLTQLSMSIWMAVTFLSACGLKSEKNAELEIDSTSAGEKYTISDSAANQVIQGYQSCMAKKEHTANECEQIVANVFGNVGILGVAQSAVVQNRTSPDNNWLTWYLIHSLLTSGNRTYERDTVMNHYVQQGSSVRTVNKFGSGSSTSSTTKPSSMTYSPAASNKSSSSSSSSNYSSSKPNSSYRTTTSIFRSRRK